MAEAQLAQAGATEFSRAVHRTSRLRAFLVTRLVALLPALALLR